MTVIWIILVAQVIFGAAVLRPFSEKTLAILESEGLVALQNPIYTKNHTLLSFGGTLKVLVLVLVILIIKLAMGNEGSPAEIIENKSVKNSYVADPKKLTYLLVEGRTVEKNQTRIQGIVGVEESREVTTFNSRTILEKVLAYVLY